MIDYLGSRLQIPQKTLTKMPIIATLYRSMMKLDLFMMKLDSLTFVFSLFLLSLKFRRKFINTDKL